jgi:hypothetical protein
MLIYYGPFALLFIAWMTFSDVPVSEIFTWKNISRHAGIAQNAIVGFGCLALYVIAILYLTVRQIINHGIYLWIEGNNLKWSGGLVGTSENISGRNIELQKRRWFWTIKFSMADGRSKSIPLTIADFPPSLATLVSAELAKAKSQLS